VNSTSTTRLLRYGPTLLLLGAALWGGKGAWDNYMESAWTRDGRVRADVINVGADVAGLVTEVRVRDNQLVHKGEVLFVLDRARYASALAQAGALLAARESERGQRADEARRRAELDADTISAESRAAAQSAHGVAGAQYAAALAQAGLARLNLERTVVRAPATGYVTNLNVHAGDYAAAGAAKLAVIDSASFYVLGYFEETKLALLQPGLPVRVELMSGGPALRGHIESIAHGITDRDGASGRELLADVNPTFNWVRLAQRVPVRIRLDAAPGERALVAGTTCTVTIVARAAHHA
jgi:RND family efflux transporter MFP subunit